MKKFLGEIRVLRIILTILTLIVSVFSRFAGEAVVYRGWEIITSLVVPAIVPILFFVILLDLLMAWVFRVEAEGYERERLGRVMGLDLVLVAILVVSWVGYFIALAG